MPLTDDELRAHAIETCQGAVIFHRLVPSQEAARAASYLGGLPRLPDPDMWPTLGDGDQRCTFLGQVDLATLPSFVHDAGLPRRGSLLFFAETDTSAAENGFLHGAVLFFPEGTAGYGETPPAPDLMPVYGGEMVGHEWFGNPTYDEQLGTDHLACVLPRWPLQATAVTTFSRTFHEPLSSTRPEDGGPSSEDFRRYAQIVGALQDEAWRQALGFAPSRVVPDTFTSSFGERGPDWPFRVPGVGAWMPDDAWPYLWINVRIAVAELLRKLGKARFAVNTSSEIALLDDQSRIATQWLHRAPLDRAFHQLSASEWEAFRAWITELQNADSSLLPGWSINKAISESVVVGADAVFGYAPDMALQLPPGLRHVVASRATPCREWGAHPQIEEHQLLGHGKSVQGAPERAAPTHILLMQFDSDDAAMMTWGDGGALQFWIRPEDLRDGNFDNIVITGECH